MDKAGISRRKFSKSIAGGSASLLSSRGRGQTARRDTWSTVQGNAAHTGHCGAIQKQSIDQGIRWETDVGGQLRASPVVTDGTAFVGTTDGRFGAYDLEDGNQQWVREGTAEIRRAAAADSETVYVNLDEGTLYALDAKTGETRWRRTMETEMYRNGGPVLIDDTLYTADAAGFVYAIDVISGEIRWRVETEASPPVGTIAVTDDRVYLAKPTIIEALATEDGRRSWKTRFDGLVWGPPTVADDIYLPIGPDPSVIAAFSAESGELRWTYTTTTESDLDDHTPDERISIFPWSPIVAEDELIVADRGGAVASVAKNDGSELWRHTISGRPTHHPVTCQDTVYVPTERNLVAISRSSGKVRWSALDGATPTSPAFAGDRLLVSTTDGRLLALGRERGFFARWSNLIGAGIGAGLVGLGGYTAYRTLRGQPQGQEDTSQ